MSKFESRHQCAQAMECKGREYFVYGYTQAESMPDEETEKLFNKAEEKYWEYKKAVDDLAVAFGLPTEEE